MSKHWREQLPQPDGKDAEFVRYGRHYRFHSLPGREPEHPVLKPALCGYWCHLPMVLLQSEVPAE